MPIEYVLDSLDGVEESLHEVYEERDGKFHFSPDKYAEQKALGLKTNNVALKKDKDKIRKDFEDFKKRFADFDDQGIESFRAWKEARELAGDGKEGDGKEGDGKDNKKPDDIAQRYQQQLTAERQKWQAAKEAELKTRDDAFVELKAKYERALLRNALKDLSANAGIFPNEIETFVDFVIFKNHFKLNGEDAVIFMEDGEESVITPDKAISEELREKYPRFYEAQAQGGSGSQGGKGPARSIDWHKLSPSERIAHGRKINKTRA